MSKLPKDLPFWFHQGNQAWCKKHKGKFHYFKGATWQEALKVYELEWPQILQGKQPKREGEPLVKDVVNAFLDDRRAKVDMGELSSVMFSNYHNVCEVLVDAFGKSTPVKDLDSDSFANLKASMAKRWPSPVTVGNFIQRVRTVFKFGYDVRLLDVPVRFGPSFAKPPKRLQRLARAAKGSKMVEAKVLRQLIKEADHPLRAMILLGINCGFGQMDCSDLHFDAIDSKPGWVDLVRKKTGVGRRAKLWPETVKAIAQARKLRPAPLEDEGLDRVFLTRFGRPFVRFSDKGGLKRGSRTDAVGQEFNKLTKRLRIDWPGGFYSIRHIYRTVADEAKDHVAVALTMGHDDPSMAGVYRERISDERLIVVANCVHERGQYARHQRSDPGDCFPTRRIGKAWPTSAEV